MRRFVVGVTTAVALGMAFAVPAQAALPDGFAGMNAQFLFFGPPTNWDSHMAAMASGGVQTVRSDATWGTAEPAPPVLGNHLYSWSLFDQWVTALAHHGLRWQPVVAYSTLWAASQTGDDHSPPSSNADYAAYAAALAARYGPGGAFWSAHPELQARPVRTYEIWNEENLYSFWHPGANPGAYANLYAAARAAIHAVDPSAVAMVGGLNSGTDTPKFVEAMLAARPDLRDQLDAVGIHPYAASADASLALVVRLRRGLQFLGSDAPIAVTEVGWSTNTDAGDTWRAGQLSLLTTDLARSDCGVSAVQPHTWVTHDPQLNTEDGYGLVHTDGRQTRSAVAYLAAIRAVQAGSVDPPGTLRACWPDAPVPAPAPPPAAAPASSSGDTSSSPAPAGDAPPAPSDPGPPAPVGPEAVGPATAAPVTKRKATPKCKRVKTKRRGHHRAKKKRCVKKKKAPRHKP